jgi:hypothetical protein
MRWIAAGVTLALAACQPAPSEPSVTDADYRPPLGQNTVGAAYFKVRSPQADRIVGVSSPDAASIEMHATVDEGGMSRMERLDGLDLPAGEVVAFEPGGRHLMVFSPRPLAAGAALKVTIELQSGALIDADFPAADR